MTSDAAAREAALRHLYAACHSKRLSPAEQARVAYAASALEQDSSLAYRWLGDALARLGDRCGAKEVFTKAAGRGRNEREVREVAQGWQKAKVVLASANSGSPEVTLDGLRKAGWAGVQHTVSLVTPVRTGRKIPCPRCAGQGEIADFSHVEDGICFLCYGSRTIWEKAPAL